MLQILHIHVYNTPFGLISRIKDLNKSPAAYGLGDRYMNKTKFSQPMDMQNECNINRLNSL